MGIVNRGARVVAFVAIPIAAVLGGCTSGNHSPSPLSSPTGSARDSTGVIGGDVAVCAGPAARPSRPTTVRIIQAGSLVASARVIAGDPAHQHYRVAVAPGRYRVVATNWPGVQHDATVRVGLHTTVDFPNVCD